jgi:hypothetical protein
MQTVVATTARSGRSSSNTITYGKGLDSFAHLSNNANVLMAEDDTGRQQPMKIYMHVGSADATQLDPNDRLAWTSLWDRAVHQANGPYCFVQCNFHSSSSNRLFGKWAEA